MAGSPDGHRIMRDIPRSNSWMREEKRASVVDGRQVLHVTLTRGERTAKVQIIWSDDAPQGPGWEAVALARLKEHVKANQDLRQAGEVLTIDNLTPAEEAQVLRPPLPDE